MTTRLRHCIVWVCAGLSLAMNSVLGDEYNGDAIAPAIETSPIRLELAPYLQLPPTADATDRNRARINMLKPFGDGSGRLAVSDLRGALYIVRDGSFSVYLDLSAEFDALFHERGLGTGFGAFAFHPDFAENGLFYTTHNEPLQSAPAEFPSPEDQFNEVDRRGVGVQAVLTEWKAEEPGNAVFEGSRREVLRIGFPRHTHGVQEIAFNHNLLPDDPDYGNLYVCVGEGSTLAVGLLEPARSVNSVYGSVLRIDPLGRDSDNGQYGIVAANPWAQDDDPITLAEIFAYGFRNPHRISWDSGGDGKALVTDIGEVNIEEVNILQPGLNYGWNLREGTFGLDPVADLRTVFDLDEGEDERNGFSFTYPVAQYDRDEGEAIIGGPVYRGASMPLLQGIYVFGDIVNGRVFGVNADELEPGKQSEIHELLLEMDGEPVTMLELVGGGERVDLRFGSDLEGELYVMEKIHGNVYKVVGARLADPD